MLDAWIKAIAKAVIPRELRLWLRSKQALFMKHSSALIGPKGRLPEVLPRATRRVARQALSLMNAFTARVRLSIGTQPVSYLWGADRGLAICRYYVDQFLQEFSSDISGDCLEFQNDEYTTRFGRSAVTKLDILHIDDSHPSATIVADISKPNDIPGNYFDCIICTHVLHHVFELDKAVHELYRILKPGGTLLVAVPQVGMCDPGIGRSHGLLDLWRFSEKSLYLLLANVFGPENVTVRVYGNSLTAAGQIRGLAAHEFTKSELNSHDPRFPVEVCARAMKPSEAKMLVSGFEKYAKEWSPDKIAVVAGHRVQYLGDEWTGEAVRAGVTTYGLSPEVVSHFDDYIKKHLLDPYLPSCAAEGLEIGPGGGRLTELLIPRTRVLHLADISEAMLRHLRQRFAGVNNLHYYRTDGMTLPALPPESLDYVIAFDVFVHFEPRLFYWYLRQIGDVLKPGGTCIIHYSNVLTPIGWHQFGIDLESNVQHRADFGAFGVMCPQLMSRFVEALQLEVISSDIGLIPRDAIAVFRKPMKD